MDFHRFQDIYLFSLSLQIFFLMQYLNRGCTRYFATKDTDQKVLQNRKSPEVKYLCSCLITDMLRLYLLE